MEANAIADEFAKRAAKQVMEYAAAYLRHHSYTVKNYKAACNIMRDKLKAKVVSIYDECLEAAKLRMHHVAEKLFVTSLNLIAIESAKAIIEQEV